MNALYLTRALSALLFVGLLTGVTYGQELVSIKSLNIEIPNNWYLVEETSGGGSNRTVIASDQMPEEQAVMLITQVSKKNRTLEAMLTMARNQIITRMDGVIEHSDNQDVGEKPAFTLVYIGRSSQGKKDFRAFQRTVIDHEDDFYILQAVTDLTNFPGHAGAIEKMVKSIGWSISQQPTNIED